MNDKKMGLGSAVSVCVGLIVATSCLLSLGLGTGLAGKGFILAMFIVVILNILLSFSFRELHDLMPEAEGGLGQYTLAGLGPVPSIVSNLSAYVITNMLAGSVELAMCGLVIQQTFLKGVPALVISLSLLAFLTVINYLGVDIFAKIQNFTVIALIGSLILLGVISSLKLGVGNPLAPGTQTPPVVTGFSGILSLTALAFWMFIGIEFVIPVSKDLKNPRRDVPLSMILGVCLLFLVQSLLSTGMRNYVSLEELRTNTMPHILFAERVMGKAGSYWMGLITILAGISTINTVLGSVARILCGMADAGLMPSHFSKKNKRGTPTPGLFLMTGVISFILVIGIASSSGLTNFLLAASCFWLTSYILVNLTVLMLRRRYPNAPGRDKRFTLWGIPQIICMIGNVYMIWNIAEGDARIFIYKIYSALLIITLLFAFYWVKIVKKADAFRPVSLDEINDVKLENKVVDDQAPASVLVN